LDRLRIADRRLIDSLQVSQEQSRTGEHFYRFGAAIATATASAEMLTEALENSAVQIMIG
jgi:hypothetical protein